MKRANAIVTICPHRPDLLGHPLLGHVGFGYEYPNGEWCIGAVEGTEWRNDLNGFWAVKVPNLQAALHYFSNMKNYNAEYDYYKLLTVTTGVKPNPRYADQIVSWVAKQPYKLFGRNCMNSAFDILYAFSGGRYNNSNLPNPNLNWIPNGWFNAIKTNDFYYLPKNNLETISNFEKIEITKEDKLPEWREKGNDLYLVERSKEEAIEVKVASPKE